MRNTDTIKDFSVVIGDPEVDKVYDKVFGGSEVLDNRTDKWIDFSRRLNLKNPSYEDDALEGLPVTTFLNYSEGGRFDRSNQKMDEFITIPLHGGKLEFGRVRRFDKVNTREEDYGIQLRITAPSHRSEDQANNEVFSCDVIVTVNSGVISSKQLERSTPEDEVKQQAKQLNDAKRYLGFFDPIRDINWTEISHATDVQKIFLSKAVLCL